MKSYKILLVQLKTQSNVKLIIKYNVYNINNNVIAKLILLNVKLITNVYQMISYIYVNQLVLFNVLIHYSQYYVKMDNVDNQLRIVQHNQFVHHNSIYVQI